MELGLILLREAFMSSQQFYGYSGASSQVCTNLNPRKVEANPHRHICAVHK